MNNDLQVDERRAAALPVDWPADFSLEDGYQLHPCEKCIRTFRGAPFRELCKECS